MYIIPLLTLSATFCTYVLAETTPMDFNTTSTTDYTSIQRNSTTSSVVSVSGNTNKSSLFTKESTKVFPIYNRTTTNVVKNIKSFKKPSKKKTSILDTLMNEKQRSGFAGANKIKVYSAVVEILCCISLIFSVFKLVF